MSFLIDGSNVLGGLSGARESVEAKRELVRALATLARSKRTRVYCFFDGEVPEAFARSLGNVSVIFSGRRTADEVILERVQRGRGHKWTLVTSDRGLAARASGRDVTVVRAEDFRRSLDSPSEPGPVSEDWTAYFTDPVNRHKF